MSCDGGHENLAFDIESDTEDAAMPMHSEYCDLRHKKDSSHGGSPGMISAC